MSLAFAEPGQTFRAFPTGGRYLVGVSGGRDSVVLLHWLLELGYRRLVVCHLNHQLRGRAAAADARFVKGLATKAKLPFAGGSIDVAAAAASRKLSLETAGREARYGFFAAVARRRRCHTIFLGHHADDLVETTLLNLFRGTGPGGLANMRGSSVREVAGVALTIVRPLLGVWRAEIDEYIRQHRLKFREDASNRELTAARNRIRLEILPNIEKQLGREVRRSIWRTANLIAADEEWLSELSRTAGADAKALSVAELRTKAPAWQRRIVHGWLRDHAVSDVGYDVVNSIVALVPPSATNAKINLPRGLHVRRRAGKIFIEGLPPAPRGET